MKRLHVHVGVTDLHQSIRFYSTLFAAKPTVVKDDYAKWMLDDPRVNFAISSGAHAGKGIEHLGIQVESGNELAEVYARLKAADGPLLEEGQTTCCYAKSEKSWIADPNGVAEVTTLNQNGYAAGEFEIHFPKRFTRMLKALRLLPARAYFALVRKGTKL
mgnify:CR=1 FL=1